MSKKEELKQLVKELRAHREFSEGSAGADWSKVEVCLQAADAIEALAAENMKFADVRTWFHYPIVMPLKDGSGPASDAECDTITWEVWDKLLNTHGSFDNLPDAINEAMRLNNAITEAQK